MRYQSFTKKDYRTLRRILEKYSLTIRPRAKYSKKPFTGNLIEEAFKHNTLKAYFNKMVILKPKPYH